MSFPGGTSCTHAGSMLYLFFNKEDTKRCLILLEKALVKNLVFMNKIVLNIYVLY